MNIVVSKFGGTSVATSKNISLIKNILSDNPLRQIVVVSAPGKRNADDIKITDCLLEVHSLKSAGKKFAAVLNKVKQRFIALAAELKVNFNAEGEFKKLEGEINSGASSDYIASRGEYYSAKIIADFLGFNFLDAKDVIVFSEKNKVNLEASQKAFAKHFKINKKIVVPGFYGKDKNGNIVTFSRGGSDVTGAVLAYCADASVYENFTDVSGFLCADPRIVKNPRGILCLTYRDLRELSYMGANVLHTDCAFYASKKNIPINIKNTFAPNHPGTLILSERDINLTSSRQLITGIAGQKGFSLIYIEKYNLNETVGVFESVAKIFANFNVSIEHMPTNIDGLTVVFKCSSAQVIKNIVLAIKKTLQPDKILSQQGIALVCLVLGNVEISEGLKIIFSTLNKNCIETITTSKDSSSLSVNIGIKEADYEKTITCLYNAFENKK